MMKAIGVTTCGRPEVLHVVELPDPHAGAGEVRMRRKATSVSVGICFFSPLRIALRTRRLYYSRRNLASRHERMVSGF